VKDILHILTGREKKITEEETVKQPLPHKDFRFANPFIVIHHIGPRKIEPGSKERIYPHPHRGFSPFTFMLQGEGFHKDNAGNDQVVKAGGVQWMFAGKGVMHSEGPTSSLLATGGVQEAIQLWINAPKAKKWDEPFYQSAAKDELPVAISSYGAELRLASGVYNGFTGPIKNLTPIVSMVGEVKAGHQLTLYAKAGYWTLLYVISGKISCGGHEINAFNLIVFEKENSEIYFTAEENSQILFLSAEPIDEPVAAKDNFVMNTQQEIEQAIADYKNGVFGTLDY
jgi:redox-sensitive bicupin YhaK (pirin superfamily)